MIYRPLVTTSRPWSFYSPEIPAFTSLVHLFNSRVPPFSSWKFLESLPTLLSSHVAPTSVVSNFRILAKLSTNVASVFFKFSGSHNLKS